MNRVALGLASGICVFFATHAVAQSPQAGFSNFGMPGVIDMPTAGVMPDGTLALSLMAMAGTQRATLSFQALPRVTVSFRYSGIGEWRPGYRLMDRSFDLHWQILDEGRYLPALALGLRDVIGTGTYSSEYVVATRHFGPRLTASLGMGWGRLATHGGFRNPLAALHPGFATRPRGFTGLGGLVEFSRFFRGDAALFGGIEYRATDRLTLLAEYSSDAYVRERAHVRHRTPVNLGFRYRLGQHSSVSGFLLHGSTFGIAASFALNPAQPPSGGVRVSTPVPVARRIAAPPGAEFGPSTGTAAAHAVQLREALRPAFAAEGLRLDSVDIDGRRVVILLANQRHDVLPRAIGRAARIMTHALPPGVEDIVVIPMHDGVVGTAITLNRSDLERYEHDPAGSAGLWAGARLSDPLDFPGVGRLWQPLAAGRDRLTWSVGPYLALSFFDPASPIRADFGLEGVARYSFAENLSANLAIRQRLAGNIADGSIGPNSPGYPRVRTNASLYSSSRPTVDRLTLDYTIRPARNVFGRVTLGWMERMYAGVSAEALWSPANSRFAFGVEINRVAQRDPHSVLGVNALQITTGHASAYLDIGRGFHGQLDVGRYLAGDTGATVRLERVFANGIRVGAYATLTDMPFRVYGEGSFDRGITLSVPLTALTGTPSRLRPNTTIQSLTRDGGALLNVPGRLYPTVQESRAQALRRSWGVVLQ